ncbi:MAG: iron chelate uptake ABC transporter family permease subunit, partial [Pseudomonadota bacterium]
RGMSYIGHGLSHAAFGGAVLGFVLHWNFYVGAAAAAFLAALLIHRLADNKKIKSDAAIGIVTTAMFALGVAIISSLRQFTQSFEASLFGNILGVTEVDLRVIATVLALTVLGVFFGYKPLLFSTFDTDTARIFGLRTGSTQFLFSLILALAVIAAMNIVGVTMIAAALIIPAITARLLTDHFAVMLFLSTLCGAVMGVGGMFLSYYFDAASGATIVLFGALMFIGAWSYSQWREWRAVRRMVHAHGATRHAHPHTHRGVHAHTHDAGDHHHAVPGRWVQVPPGGGLGPPSPPGRMSAKTSIAREERKS